MGRGSCEERRAGNKKGFRIRRERVRNRLDCAAEQRVAFCLGWWEGADRMALSWRLDGPPGRRQGGEPLCSESGFSGGVPTTTTETSAVPCQALRRGAFLRSWYPTSPAPSPLRTPRKSARHGNCGFFSSTRLALWAGGRMMAVFRFQRRCKSKLKAESDEDVGAVWRSSRACLSRASVGVGWIAQRAGREWK